MAATLYSQIRLDISDLLKGLREAKEQATKAVNNLNQQFQKVKLDIDGESVSKNINKSVTEAAQKSGSTFKSTMGGVMLGGLAMQGVAAAVQGVKAAIDVGIEFDKALKDMSAITGVSGKALDDFGQSARKFSLEFGGTATSQIMSFKGILSRLGPDIAKSPEALNQMTIAVNTLAKASGLDAQQSMDAMTTAALQMGVDLSDPIKAAKEMTDMINVMAAGAKEGAAEVPQISESLKVSGAVAKASGVSFLELNAAIQTMAIGGKYGAEAGTAIRNVMIKMQEQSKEAETSLNKLGMNGKDLAVILNQKGLGGALEYIQTAFKGTNDEIAKNQVLIDLFGMENIAAGATLVQNAEKLEVFKTKLEGTNTAFEQAKINMSSSAEGMERFKAMISDIGIEIFKAIQPLLTALMPVIKSLLTTLTPIIQQIANVLSMAFQGLLPVIQPILEAITRIIGRIAPAVSKLIPVLTEMIGKIVQALLPGIEKLINTGLDVFIESLIPLLIAWTNIMNALLPIILPIVQAVLALADELAKLATGVMKTFLDTMTSVYNGVATFVGWIKQAVDYVIGFGKAIIDIIGKALTPFINAFYTIKGAIMLMWEGIKQIADFIGNVAYSAFSKLYNIFESLRKSIIDGLVWAFNKVFDAISYVVGIIVNHFIKGLVWAWETIKSVHSIILSFVSGALTPFKGIFDAIIGVVKDAVGWIIKAGEAVGGFLGFLNKKGKGENNLAPVSKGYKDLAKDAKDAANEVNNLNNQTGQTPPIVPPETVTPSAGGGSKDDDKKAIAENLNKYLQELRDKNAKDALDSEKDIIDNTIKEYERQKAEIEKLQSKSDSEKLKLTFDIDKKISEEQLKLSVFNSETSTRNELIEEERKYKELLESNKFSSSQKLEITKAYEERRKIIEENNIKTISEIVENYQQTELTRKTDYLKKYTDLQKTETIKSFRDQAAAIIQNDETSINKRLELNKQALQLEYRDALQVTGARTAEQELKYREYLDKVRSFEIKALEEQVKISKSGADRERAEAILQAKKTLDERLNEVKGNYELEEEAHKDYLLAIGKADEAYIRKTDVLRNMFLTTSEAIQDVALNMADGVMQMFDGLELGMSKVRKYIQDIETLRKDDTQKQKNELNKQIDDLKKSLNNKEITYEQYIDKLKGLQEQLTDVEKGENSQRESFWKKLQNSLVISASKTAESYQSKSQETVKEHAKAVEQFGEGSAQAIALQNQLIGQSAALAVAQMVAVTATGKATLGDYVAVVLDTMSNMLMAQIPGWVLGIFGTSVSQLGPVLGPITAAGITATLMGLVALAKSALGRATGEIDIQGAGTETSDDNVRFVSKGESIISAKGTKNDKNILSWINGGKSSQEYFEKFYLPETLKSFGIEMNSDAVAKPFQTLANYINNPEVLNSYYNVATAPGLANVNIINSTIQQTIDYRNNFNSLDDRMSDVEYAVSRLYDETARQNRWERKQPRTTNIKNIIKNMKPFYANY